MLSKRLTILVTGLLLAFGWTGVAQAKEFFLLGGSGGQLQIGGGLPLPGQRVKPSEAGTRIWGATLTPTNMTQILPAPAGPGPEVFPPLLIGLAATPPATMISGTTGTAMKLVIPTGVLTAMAGQRGVPQKTNNPGLYAVSTNLVYVWPNTQVTLSRRDMTTDFFGVMLSLPTMGPDTVYSAMGIPTAQARVVYRNPGKTKYMGGVANFSIQSILGSGALPSKAITLWANLGGVPYPCQNPLYTPPGTGNPACFAGLLFASPAGLAAAGGKAKTPVGTPYSPPISGNNKAAVSAGPLGTILQFSKTGVLALPNNQAASIGFFWTTGQVQLSINADGTPEYFLMSGSDSRDAAGNGTVQLVSGSLSERAFTGPNSNRGWIRLNLSEDPPPTVPAMSNLGLAALSASLLAVGLFVALRRQRANTVGA